MHAERVSPRPARIVWCCTCDTEPEVGPINHLSEHPDHFVVETAGDLYVWRP